MRNNKKIKRAVLVSLCEEEDGMRLSLDDVTQKDEMPDTWKQDRPVTSKLYSQETIENLSLDDQELAEIAYYILARLRASKKVWGE